MASSIPAISEDYSDIIVKKQLLPFQIDERYQEQTVDRQYSILYAPLSENLYAAHQIGYTGVPKLIPSSVSPAWSIPVSLQLRRSLT